MVIFMASLQPVGSPEPEPFFRFPPAVRLIQFIHLTENPVGQTRLQVWCREVMVCFMGQPVRVAIIIWEHFILCGLPALRGP